jgi:GTP-binding protein Era
MDTPGLLDPRYALQKLMRREIESALADADVVVLVLDATDLPTDPAPLLRRLGEKPVLVALNKVDAVKDKKQLLPVVRDLAAAGMQDVLLVSARTASGIEDLDRAVAIRLPEAGPYYPADSISERPERFFVAEFIREAIFNRFSEEVPYATTVAIDEFKERPGRKDFVRATVYVERDSQKAIMIGRDGAALKRVGTAARRNIERFLGRQVYLELWVKVSVDWREDERFLRDNVYGRG